MGLVELDALYGLPPARLDAAIERVNALAQAQPYLQAVLLIHGLDEAGSPSGVGAALSLARAQHSVLCTNVCIVMSSHDIDLLREVDEHAIVLFEH